MRIAAWLSALFLWVACVEDDDLSDAGLPLPADGGLPTPTPPALGPQVDRVGRPLVTSLLLGDSEDPQRAASLSAAWNEEDDPLLWGRFAPELQGTLGVFDGLDGTCGQLAPAFTFGRFDSLALLLADDRLFVDTRVGICQQPLAVEAEALGLIPVFDCGGRAPAVDAVDAMLSLFTSGGRTAVSDGLEDDPDGEVSTIVFPFLRPPVR